MFPKLILKFKIAFRKKFSVTRFYGKHSFDLTLDYSAYVKAFAI